jgi:hypothetical protein
VLKRYYLLYKCPVAKLGSKARNRILKLLKYKAGIFLSGKREEEWEERVSEPLQNFKCLAVRCKLKVDARGF